MATPAVDRTRIIPRPPKEATAQKASSQNSVVSDRLASTHGASRAEGLILTRCRPDLKLSLAWTVKSSISLARGRFDAVLDKVYEIVSFVSVHDKVHDAGGDSTIP